MRVKIYSREGCHLCEVAYAVVEQVCTELGEDYEVLDVDSDYALYEQYSDDVPVIAVDERVIARWRVSPQQLLDALT